MIFLADETRKIAVDSLLTEAQKSFADLAASEAILISAARVIKLPSPLSSRVWEPQEPAGTFRAAIGQVTQAPVAGTFYLGFTTQTSGVLVSGKRYLIVDFIAGDSFTNVGAGSNADGIIFTASGTTPTTWTNSSILREITTALAYDISAANLSTALNALATITTAGGVTVSTDSGQFLITFVTAGTRTQIVGDATSLAPSGTIAEIGTLLDGSALPAIAEIQTLRFVQSPAALADLSDAAPAAAGAVDPVAVGGAGVNAKYRVTLYTSDENHAYDGRFSITVAGEESGLIAWDATSEDALTIIEAMDAIGAGNVTVFRESEGVYLIGFQGDLANTDMAVMTVDVSSLHTVPYMTGELDLRTPAIQLLFDGAETCTAEFVIEYTPSGGKRREIFRQTITLIQALIAEASLTPSPVIQFWTAAESQVAIDAAIAALPAYGTMATQDATAVAITGGTITGATISGGTISATTFNGIGMGGTGDQILLIRGGTSVSVGPGALLYVETTKQIGIMNSIQFFANDGGGTVTFDIGTGGTLGTGAFAAVKVGANPTGSVGLSAVNGAAATFLRSDGAPALDQSIAPTWTGAHTFSSTFTLSPANVSVVVAPTGTGTHSIDNMTIGQTTPLAVGLTSLRVAVIQRTSTYTATASDFCIECTSGTFALNLPTAVGIAGRMYFVANTGAGTITLTGNGAELINGSNTRTMSAATQKRIISNGTGWLEF